jgi:hypothetical protein
MPQRPDKLLRQYAHVISPVVGLTRIISRNSHLRPYPSSNLLRLPAELGEGRAQRGAGDLQQPLKRPVERLSPPLCG